MGDDGQGEEGHQHLDDLDFGIPTTTSEPGPTEESLIDCGGEAPVQGFDDQPPPNGDSNLDLLSGGVLAPADIAPQPPTSTSNPQNEEDLLGGFASDGPSMQPSKGDNLVSLASEAPQTSEQQSSGAEKGSWDEHWLLGPNKDENMPKNIEPGGDIDLLLLDK